MSVDSDRRLAARGARPPADAARERYDRATADLDPPLALVDEGAFDRGVMCYTLAEALWLHAAGTCDDLLVAYPTVDRGALRALAADDRARQHVTIMADSEAHLDVVDRALGAGHPEIKICLDLDVSWRPLARRPAVHIGTRRSPLHTPEQAVTFARAVDRRAGFRLAGVMGYEGQIAGLGDAPAGHPVRAQLIRLIQARSVPELIRRRTEAIRQIQAADALTPGDRVWMRHAKAGELAERFRSYHVLGEDGQLTTVPTYRGEGKCFG